MLSKKFFGRKEIILVLGLFLLISIGKTGQAEGLKVRAKARLANIRANSSLKTEKIGRVKKGTIFESEGRKGEWCFIHLPLKFKGYTLPGYIRESIAEQAGREAPVTEIETFQEVDSDRVQKLGLSVRLGYAFLTDRDYNGDISLCGNLSYPLHKNIVLEMALMLNRGSVKGSSKGLSEGRLYLIPIHLSVRGCFPIKNKIYPYALGGAGYYLNRFTLESKLADYWSSLGFEIKENIENSLGFHFGIGMDYFIKENLALNTDIRYCIVKTKGDWSLIDQMSEISTSGEIEQLNLNSFTFGVGLKYLF